MEMSGQFHAPTALPRKRASDTHWIGVWVGSRANLDAVLKRKIPSPENMTLRNYGVDAEQVWYLKAYRFKHTNYNFTYFFVWI
jgi:hypothetical protein